MDSDRYRLARCFQAAIPELLDDQLDRATPASVPTWDSIANVTLLALIEEEFGVPLHLHEQSALSFEGILDSLRKQREDGSVKCVTYTG